MIAFGISQQKSPGSWLKYMPGFVRCVLPIHPITFMRVHSVGNILLGTLLTLGLLQPVSIWLAIGWWVFVTPFAFYAEFSMGLRDFAIVLSLIALLVLNQA